MMRISFLCTIKNHKRYANIFKTWQLKIEYIECTISLNGFP